MKGRYPKPPERRQGHRTAVVTPITQSRRIETPAPPDGVLAVTRRAWAELWLSDVATLYVESDVPALRRLFEYRDEQRRCLMALRRSGDRLTAGSTGQMRPSPLYDVVTRIERLIVPLEDRYGLSVAGRLRLGVSLGVATKSLADLNADLWASDDADEPPVQLPGLPPETNDDDKGA